MKTKIIGNLEWQEEISPDRMTWSEAKEYAASLGEGWRLPTRVELLTLIDDTRFNPACSVFPDCSSEWFWSSSPFAFSTVFAWAVHFIGGGTYNFGTSNGFRVRCVR